MKKRIPCLVILAALGCAACSGGGRPKLAIEDVEDAYYQMTCARFIECSENTFISLLIPDQATCVSFFLDMNADEHGSIRDMIAAVEGGRIDYDGRAAYACIAAQEALSCEEFGKVDPESCREVFSGTIADGEACELNAECVSGYCDTAQECPGTCLAAVPAGQGCDLNDECTPGTRCVRDTCQTWTGPLVADAPCEPGDDDWCGEGLFCHAVDEVCTARVAIGEACESAGDLECVKGAICVGDAQGNTSCVAMTVADTEGAVCDNRNGIVCAMYAGLSCKIDNFQGFTGTCVPTPGLGDTCFEAGQNPTMTQCSFYDRAYCDVPPGYQSDGVCALLKEDGQACSGDDCLGYCGGDGLCASDSNTVCD